MLNRVTVKIDGIDYTVVAEENEEYIRKTALMVDQGIKEIKAATPHSSLMAAVLTAMNIADKYYKSLDSSDHLRIQVKEYAEECAKLRTELTKKK